MLLLSFWICWTFRAFGTTFFMLNPSFCKHWICSGSVDTMVMRFLALKKLIWVSPKKTKKRNRRNEVSKFEKLNLLHAVSVGQVSAWLFATGGSFLQAVLKINKIRYVYNPKECGKCYEDGATDQPRKWRHLVSHFGNFSKFEFSMQGKYYSHLKKQEKKTFSEQLQGLQNYKKWSAVTDFENFYFTRFHLLLRRWKKETQSIPREYRR